MCEAPDDRENGLAGTVWLPHNLSIPSISRRQEGNWRDLAEAEPLSASADMFAFTSEDCLGLGSMKQVPFQPQGTYRWYRIGQAIWYLVWLPALTISQTSIRSGLNVGFQSAAIEDDARHRKAIRLGICRFRSSCCWCIPA